MDSFSVTLTYIVLLVLPVVCSLWVCFYGAGGCPKYSPSASCCTDAVNHFLSQPWLIRFCPHGP